MLPGALPQRLNIGQEWRSGSGLGLCIARRLMAAQAGSLKVEPRYGGGASFALTLPSCPAAAISGVAEPAILR